DWCDIDLRVGGQRSIGMQAPNGQAYATTGVFLEVQPPERFVATERAGGEGGPETIVTLTLEVLADGRTKLGPSQTGFPNDDWATGAGQGWNQALDKLTGILARPTR